MTLTMGDTALELGSAQLGELRDSTAAKHDFATLRSRLAEDGYLLLRGLHEPDEVRAARRMLLENLAQNGQLDADAPLDDGRAAPGARGAFIGGRKSVSHHPAFLAVVESPRLMAWFSDLFDGPSLTFDYKWVRAVGPGGNTNAHFDVVYMGRGTRELLTCWTPLGDVDYTTGPLAILGDSPRLDRVRETYGELDVDRDQAEGHFSRDPLELVESFGGRWLTTEFRMGDALVFGMYTMHGSLNNQSDRFRLSCDTRYQRADQPVDERWVGEEPLAHYNWHAGDSLKSMAELRSQWGV